MLTLVDDEFFLKLAIEAGVSGLALKRYAPDQLIGGIRAVAAGARAQSFHLDTVFLAADIAFDGELRFSSRLLGLGKFAEAVAATTRQKN